jgi:hypothetical protein
VDFSYEFGGPRPAPAPAPDDDENLLRPEPTTSGADS